MASLSPAERDYIISGLLSDPALRVDGRSLLSPRPIETEYGVMPAANGSARVRVGGTEAVAGIKLDVGEVSKGSFEGGPGWRAKVEVDITPQALPSTDPKTLQTLSASYAALLAEHFVPSVSPLKITETRAFIPSLHIALLSCDGAIASALTLAARGAFADLQVPVTKVVGMEEEDAETQADLAGIKGAIAAGRAGKGKGRARARGGDDWDIEGDSAPLEGREELPVLVTLNLVGEKEFVDASLREEAACPARVHVFVRPGGRIAGIRMEGDGGIATERIRPLLEEARRIGLELAEALNADLP
ncbi:hypothetical protein CcaverHIS002_0601080 [Cutaneotrichosporon cavernicola]|uniref:Ribosomal RNA-processing protein 42 n=1 Tax=Cutaneotrichosporon cavernicola TaxID=279322 RepID=A0AA48QWL2_9TREE|nr:uncharacterized protein CcaverHIS019_0501180 [Cutaneotrichosporon cavernicola]BEI85821.1 hypothetical protein CcaverHIS002_0601080 [Cutaneotrichosporon cavernicola]BEI92490.1 hypothetical protein CcaverHIS019_0501180 [Cutaneotrichosporon cavernicola]BEJ00262.1 hypothetical protein CcaverHIS631_0501190 [Cutaneotrichosporon cavernicola]BEJ08032.1 hypothetical protein CcaverHIS641_0501170 [Cutaneotrichosporon cavernicola]